MQSHIQAYPVYQLVPIAIVFDFVPVDVERGPSLPSIVPMYRTEIESAPINTFDLSSIGSVADRTREISRKRLSQRTEKGLQAAIDKHVALSSQPAPALETKSPSRRFLAAHAIADRLDRFCADVFSDASTSTTPLSDFCGKGGLFATTLKSGESGGSPGHILRISNKLYDFFLARMPDTLRPLCPLVQLKTPEHFFSFACSLICLLFPDLATSEDTVGADIKKTTERRSHKRDKRAFPGRLMCFSLVNAFLDVASAYLTKKKVT